MGYVKKAAPCLRGVLRGMLFIGFSIQILLGICWICCSFGQVQGFGEPDSALYGRLLGLLGGSSAALYILQLAAAFLAGFLFLQKIRPVGMGLALWRGLAVLTVPFALQCHLALQPYSLMGSLFLLFLLALLRPPGGRRGAGLLAALLCMAVYAGLSGAVDADRRGEPGYSLEGALASRFAWPTLWQDLGLYGEEVAEAVGSLAWEASLYPDNMRLLQEGLESRVGPEAARGYYLRMAETGWEYHKTIVIRQIGWDVLGYAVTPVVFRLQMEGEAYDSYSGRNYEVMRENAPVLTRDYVDYGCWWFLYMLGISGILALLLAVPDKGTEPSGKRRRPGGRPVLSLGICILASGLLVAALTMRGAGRMDYRQTIGVNALWYMGPLLLAGGKRRKGR